MPCFFPSDSLGCGGKVIIKYVRLVHMPTLGPLGLLQHLDLQYVAPCHLTRGRRRAGGGGGGRKEEIGKQILNA